MRLPVHQDRHSAQDSMAMTSMIDVVFLLLIFFVCAASGQIHESQLATDLAPGSIESTEIVDAPKPLGEVWLRLKQRAGGTVVEVKEREYEDFASLQETLALLAEVAPEIPVILDIDADVPLGDMIRVYDACRTAQFESIHFAAKAKPTKS
jgi:biopolymer transport protein ExbD